MTMAEENFIFLLVGKTGNGKSALGNSILNQGIFESGDTCDSTTCDILVKSEQKGSCLITVVDTPGFMDTNVDGDEAKSKACQDMKKAMAQCPTDGKLALIIVLKYGDKFSNDNKISIHILKTIFGEENLGKSCIIVMTHGDAYNTKYRGKKNFEEWMREQTGTLAQLLELCGYKCVLFCNETDSEEVKVKQLEALMELVKTLDQGYTLNKFEKEKKEQCRLLLEAELPKLKCYYEQEINKIYEEMKQLGEAANTEIALKEMEHTACSLLENVDQKDSPEFIYYADGECRLLEIIRNSLKQVKLMIAEKTETVTLEQREKEICSIVNVFMQKILETNPHDPNIYVAITMLKEELKSLKTKFQFDMKGKLKKKIKIVLDKCKMALDELIALVQKERETEITQEKDCISSKINSTPVESKSILPILAQGKDSIVELETKIKDDPSKYGTDFIARLFRSLAKLKEDIELKEETVRQRNKAEDLKTEINSIQELFREFDVSDVNNKSLLADVRKRVQYLDVTELNGTYKLEVMAKIKTTKKRISKLEKRVTTVSKFVREFQNFEVKLYALELPCFVSRFAEFHKECDILLGTVNMSVSSLEDRVVLEKRLQIIKNAISNKKTENDITIATLVLGPVVPLFEHVASSVLNNSQSAPPAVMHDEERESIETENKTL